MIKNEGGGVEKIICGATEDIRPITVSDLCSIETKLIYLQNTEKLQRLEIAE